MSANDKPIKSRYGYGYKGYTIFKSKWGWRFRYEDTAGNIGKQTFTTLKEAVDGINKREVI